MLSKKIHRKHSPLFITGIPRSGTTLLYRSLLNHSSFRPTANNNKKISLYIESTAFIKTDQIFHSTNSRKFLLMDEKIEKDFLGSVKWIRAYQKLGNIPYLFFLHRINFRGLREFTYALGLNQIVMRKYFEYSKVARGMKRIIEKTPDHITKVPEIRLSFPNAKFLFIYRHPVDVFSSYKKRLDSIQKQNLKNQNTSWLEVSPQEFCKLYRRYIKLALEAKKEDPENFMLLKYEDVVASPYDFFLTICDFIGEDFEEEILPQGSPKREAPFSSFVGGRIVRQTKDWENFIDREDAMAIEKNLSELLEKLSYKNYIHLSCI